MGIFSRRKKDDDSDAWYNKGRSLAKLGQQEEAIECFDVAIRLNPENYYSWRNKGYSLDELERHEEAIECCNVAIRLNPENYYSWRNKGDSLKKLGRYIEAEKWFAKFKELNKY